MDIKIDKSKLTFQQYESLKSLDDRLRQTIISLCATDKGQSLQVEYGTALITSSSQPAFKLTHNASFELSYSYVIVDAISSILKTFFSNDSIPNSLLIVSLSFSKRTVSCEESKKEPDENQKKPEEAVQTYLPSEPRYTFDMIVLPDRVRTELMNAVKIIEYRDLIYNQWGYREVEPFARCVINMYGPAGTGKTMCAHAIARYVGKQLLALNYSEIESKYLGEAAKNLAAAFDSAKATDSVIFFDEADSFLGKRVQNVTQSSDQALNSLRSQMLILLEKFEGIVIFATNLLSNFDEAFMSRIQKHIKFELPNIAQIAEIVKKQIPNRLPVVNTLTDKELEEIAKKGEGLSGREIKNSIFEMILTKAGEGENIKFYPEDFANALTAKVESNKRIEEEKNKTIKERILRKMAEKVQEQAIEKENQSKTQEEENEKTI